MTDMTPTTEQSLRECQTAFEREFERRGFNMLMSKYGHYLDDMTEGAWRGYQAAYFTRPVDSAVNVELCDCLDEIWRRIEQARTEDAFAWPYCMAEIRRATVRAREILERPTPNERACPNCGREYHNSPALFAHKLECKAAPSSVDGLKK